MHVLYEAGLLDDMLDVLDLEEKRTGSEVQVGGFDLIFNGNHVKPARPSSMHSFLGAFNDRVPVRWRAHRELIKHRALHKTS